MSTMGRSCGVLLHVSSLPSRWGIGDLGRGADLFLDFLSSSRQSLWQILPLSPTDPGQGNSPYSGLSAFAGNPLFISPELLVEDGLLELSDLDDHEPLSVERCDYAGSALIKGKLFKRAFRKFLSSKDSEFSRFCERNNEWLDDFALFVSLKGHLEGAPWYEWPALLRDRDEDTLKKAMDDLADKIEYARFLQYVFERQWGRLRRACREKGVSVIGDVPVYVSHDSADVWAYRGLFDLDPAGRAKKVAGVPPDYFSKRGQRWGNPVYRWDVLEKDGFRWWIRRLSHALSLFDMVRIDHFRGLVKFWSIPSSERFAIKGEWVEASPEAFFLKVKEYFPDMPFIAEDLGYITPDVKDFIRRLGIPKTLVLQFAFGEDPERNPHYPANHTEDACVYTGTHDNNTSRGWFETETTPTMRSQLSGLARHKVTPETVSMDMISIAMASKASMTVYPMQDVLGLGQEAWLNTPGKPSGNWLWRLEEGQLENAPAEELAEMTARYGRKVN